MPKHIKDHESDKFIDLGGRKSQVRIYDDLKSSQFSGIEVTATIISASTTTQINTPENCSNFIITHKNTGETLYIGEETVTNTGFPMNAGETLSLEHMKKNNENEIYGYSTTAITVFCIGVK